MKVDDVSCGHRTILRAEVQVNGSSRTIEFSIPGRDIWAYQFAKIQLQHQAAAIRKQPPLGG